MECTDCGQEFENKGSRRKPYCIECAFKRAREAAEQMAARDGPYYEKWLLARAKAVKNYRAKMEKAIARYDESLGMLEHLATPVGQAEKIINYGNIARDLGIDFDDLLYL